MRINLNIDGVYIASGSHTGITLTLSNLSPFNIVGLNLRRLVYVNQSSVRSADKMTLHSPIFIVKTIQQLSLNSDDPFKTESDQHKNDIPRNVVVQNL